MKNKIWLVALLAILVMGVNYLPAKALTIDDVTGSGSSAVNSSSSPASNLSGGLQMDGTSGTALQVNPYLFKNGDLVNDSGTIFLIRGSNKIAFTNAAAFMGLGYSFKNVVNGDLSNYSAISGYVINTSQMPHPWGSWVIYNGTVYYSTAQGMLGVPSKEILYNNGGAMELILKANKYDTRLISASVSVALLSINDSRVYSNAQSPVTYNFSDDNGSVSGNFSISTTSLPTIVLNATTTPLATGTQALGEITITAPSSSAANIYDLQLVVSSTGGIFVVSTTTNIVLTDKSTMQKALTSNGSFGFVAGGSASTTVLIATGNTIPAGTSKTFIISMPVDGTLGAPGSSSLTLQLTGVSHFLVNDSYSSIVNPVNSVSVHN